MRLYYIAINQKQQGPFTIEELKKMNLPAQTLVWYKDLKNWIPISDFKELSEDTPPPLPKEHSAVEIMTNSPIQLELVKQQSTTKDFQDVSKRTIRSIKFAFARFCVLFFKSLCVYLILIFIAGTLTYFYTSPPKISTKNQLEYNKEAAKRNILVDSLLQKYGYSYQVYGYSYNSGDNYWDRENEIIRKALQERNWGSKLSCVRTHNSLPFYDREIIHQDLIDKYLIPEKVDKWEKRWYWYINNFGEMTYNYSIMNESLEEAHDKIFWHDDIFPLQAKYCILTIVVFWIIKLLIYFIKWVKLNAKSENG